MKKLTLLGSSTQLWHTQLRQLFTDDLLVFVNLAVGEFGTPGRGRIHATTVQRNVRSYPLKAHFSDAASRKRIGLVCNSESAAQWNHNQRPLSLAVRSS